MFLEIVKLSLFAHFFHASLFLLGNDYIQAVSLVITLGIFLFIPTCFLFGYREFIHQRMHCILIPLYFVTVSLSSVEEDFLVKSFCGQAVVIVGILMHRYEFTVAVPRCQRERARIDGCPGH